MASINTCAPSGKELCNLESSASKLDDVSLQSDNISIKEHLKACFKPTYQMRRLKNNGAILVLVWNFLVTTVYYYVSFKSLTLESYDCSFCFKFILLPVGLVLPVAGWLADMRFGRYNVIYWSIWTMWISAVLLTITFVVEQLVSSYTNYLQIVFLASLGIGYGGFQANIIQFGIDQLTDASTIEIISFINWYAWTYISSCLLYTSPSPRDATLSRMPSSA